MRSSIAIDGSGRVVIPKAIRDSLRLQAGDLLEIRTENDEITLRPRRTEIPLVQEMGVWVYRADRGPLSAFIPEWIDAAREERTREASSPE